MKDSVGMQVADAWVLERLIEGFAFDYDATAKSYVRPISLRLQGDSGLDPLFLVDWFQGSIACLSSTDIVSGR